MPILADDQRAVLADLCGRATAAGAADPPAILAWLNAPVEVPNPEPPRQVPRPFGWRDILGGLSPVSLGNLRNFLHFDKVLDAVNAGDRDRVKGWADFLAAPPPIIDPAEAAAIHALMDATVDDPDQPATVTGPSPFRAAFGNMPFAIPPGMDGFPEGAVVGGQATAAMVAEAMASAPAPAPAP